MSNGPKSVEAELREREQMLRNLTENLPNGATFRLVWRETGDFQFHHISESIERLTGVPSARILENPTEFFSLILDKDQERMQATGELAQKTMKQFDCQARIRTKDGDTKWLHWRSLPTKLPSGDVAWDGLVVDITPLKSAEGELWRLNDELEVTISERTKELAESERRHRTLLANLQGMVYRCRNNQVRTVEFMSEGCRSLLGIPPERFLSGELTFESVIHQEDRERVWNELQESIAGKVPFNIEYRVKHANGRWRTVLEQGRAVFDQHDHVVALEGIITDITDRAHAEHTRRSLEEQLRQAQKLEAIGTLAGGIAHDFNNILAAIMGSAELLRMDIPKDHPSYEFIQQIMTAGNRAKGLVQQILTFSKRTDSSRDVVHLQPMVKECVRLIRATIPAMVDIASEVDPACAPVMADPTQIHQVLVNLCTNAWHALPERGGRIEVKLEMVDVDEVTAAIHPDLCPGPHVRLSVRDNGGGMDRAVLERIFEPFFTTKPAGKGTGLGLSVVHGIVKAHKGAIMVESEPGKGSAFFIFLPAAKIPEPERPGEAKIIFHGNGQRILLVDDEELPGRTVEKILTRIGYQVKRFLHPDQALTDFATSPKKYDLVLSDLAMPGMSGQDMAVSMLKIRRDIPILLITGLADPATQEEAKRVGIRNVLFKPLTTEALGRELAQIWAKNEPADKP